MSELLSERRYAIAEKLNGKDVEGVAIYRTYDDGKVTLETVFSEPHLSREEHYIKY